MAKPMKAMKAMKAPKAKTLPKRPAPRAKAPKAKTLPKRPAPRATVLRATKAPHASSAVKKSNAGRAAKNTKPLGKAALLVREHLRPAPKSSAALVVGRNGTQRTPCKSPPPSLVGKKKNLTRSAAKSAALATKRPAALPAPAASMVAASEKRPAATAFAASPAKRRKAGFLLRNSLDQASTEASHVDINTSRIFAQGEFRNVYRGVYDKGPRTGEDCVVKAFKTGCVYESKYFDSDIKAVEKAAELIEAFNDADVVSKTVFLNEPEIWTGDGARNIGQKLLVEPMIKGEYFKFNSNTGYAAPDSDTMQALSHFSYHYSKGRYLICDLQGGRSASSYILTDPVIISHNKAFGGTDLGQKGIENFMAHHRCGRFCRPDWKMPKVTQLIPTMKPVSGTTFGVGMPLFSNKVILNLQSEVKKCWAKHLPDSDEVKKCWSKHLVD